MPDAPTFTLDELDAILAGNRRGAFARAVALRAAKLGEDVRTSARKYGMPPSTIYRAKLEVEPFLAKKLENKKPLSPNEIRACEMLRLKQAVTVSTDLKLSTNFSP